MNYGQQLYAKSRKYLTKLAPDMNDNPGIEAQALIIASLMMISKTWEMLSPHITADRAAAEATELMKEISKLITTRTHRLGVPLAEHGMKDHAGTPPIFPKDRN